MYKKGQPDDSFKFRPLPTPTGSYPYHLHLDAVCGEVDSDQLVFHMVGDTGSVGRPDFQKLVAAKMAEQCRISGAPSACPRFLYHLGDIVYNYGEAACYPQQFFEPYRRYPGPVFAISGNHDGDLNPEAPPYESLSAFMSVFCGKEPGIVPFSGDFRWQSNIQPNVYWTLQTPLATIIGLYGNTLKFGRIEPDQQEWFKQELRQAERERPSKALFVCLHHAPYSADTNHGSSLPMIEFLENAFKESGVRPDIVFSGHVHNYQYFSKKYPDGKTIPFVIAGAGGYDQLHPIADQDDPFFSEEHPLFKEVKLEKYCDDQHGFLKISLEKQGGGVRITGEYYTIPHEIKPEYEVIVTCAHRFCVEAG